MGVHDGHRDRMKNKLLEQGLDVFDDHNVLEFLLFYSMPRKDTNPLAHELLNSFRSLEAVFEASAEKLSKITGIGENTVTLLKLIPEVSRHYVFDKNRRTSCCEVYVRARRGRLCSFPRLKMQGNLL